MDHHWFPVPLGDGGIRVWFDRRKPPLQRRLLSFLGGIRRLDKIQNCQPDGVRKRNAVNLANLLNLTPDLRIQPERNQRSTSCHCVIHTSCGDNTTGREDLSSRFR